MSLQSIGCNGPYFTEEQHMSDFLEKSKIAFQKLSPMENDVIVVHFPTDVSYEQMRSTVTYLSQLADEFGCAIFCVNQGVTLETMSEEEMNKLGWFKKVEDAGHTLQ